MVSLEYICLFQHSHKNFCVRLRFFFNSTKVFQAVIPVKQKAIVKNNPGSMQMLFWKGPDQYMESGRLDYR